MRPRADQPFVVSEVSAIRLLASPLRQAILDLIEAGGPCTVAQLADRIGRPADRLYYHVRRLERAGLLVSGVGDGARTEAVFDVPGRPMLLDYRTSSAPHRRAVERVAAAILRGARRDFAFGLADAGARAAGPRRELWVGRIEGVFSADRVEKLNALLAEIHALLLASRRGRRSGRQLQFTFALSPVKRSSRRGAA